VSTSKFLDCFAVSVLTVAAEAESRTRVVALYVGSVIVMASVILPSYIHRLLISHLADKWHGSAKLGVLQ
jgi:hypothetical protein